MKLLTWLLKRYGRTVDLAKLELELGVELDLREQHAVHGRPSPNQVSPLIDLGASAAGILLLLFLFLSLLCLTH